MRVKCSNKKCNHEWNYKGNSKLEEAGSRIGILDFRPAKMGSFGMFKVTKWEEQ